MDLELLNYINIEMKWTIMRKGRTSMTRCPRKPRVDGLEQANKLRKSAAFERKKSGADDVEKIVTAPLKKQRLLHQSASLPPQTLCIDGEKGLSPGPQTPSNHHEDFGQHHRSKSLSLSQKTNSKTRLKNSKILKPINQKGKRLVDFSGIELLAAVACSSFVHDSTEHVEDLQHTTPPVVGSCDVDIKDVESKISSIQQNLDDHGKEDEETKVAPSKGLRLHWDLNTVMDEWDEPCNDLLVEPQLSVKHDAAVSHIPSTENCNNGLVEEPCKPIEDLEVKSTKTDNIKTSDGESSASKSDVVDSLAHPGKCEDFSNSTTSVLIDQTVHFESDIKDNPLVHPHSKVTMSESDQQLASEEAMQGNKITADHVSECCGSNVTQEEHGHMAEGDSEEKLQAGYDSPFEDGELRELIGKTEKETVYKSDKIHKDDLGTIEDPLLTKVDHGRTTDQTLLFVKEAVPNDEIKQEAQVDTFERPHFDESRKDFCERKDLLRIEESTSFDAFRNGEYGWRNRSSTSGDLSARVWDLKSHRSLDSNYSRNVNPRGVSYRTHDRRPSSPERNNGYGSHRGDLSTRVWDLKSHRSLDSNYSRNLNPRGVSYRTHDRRPSSPERNNGYGSHRGLPPARSHSRDRYRFHSQEYHDSKPCYLERKPRFSTNFNRQDTRPVSRSRSRSGSPIAWHFQKRKNLDTSNPDEIETVTRDGRVSPERSYKSFDERRSRDDEFRDSRRASVKQPRFDPVGYPERLKSDDYFRFAQRPARFSQLTGYKYKGNSDPMRKHDGYYEKVEPRGAL